MCHGMKMQSKPSPGMTFWEKTATTRWGKYVSETERRAIIRGQALAGQPGRALEVGCDGGRWTRMLTEMGWDMTCTDVDRKALEICRHKAPAAKCLWVDPEQDTIPCESRAFSLALCIEVAPVIQSGWFLSEAARVLQDKGVLVAVVWNRASIRGWMHRRGHRAAKGTRPEFYEHSYSSWKRRLFEAGFEMVHSEGFCWGPFGRASNSRATTLCAKLERLLCLHRLTSLSPWVVVIARKKVFQGVSPNLRGGRSTGV